jgi:hypothetical protein
VFRTIGDGWLAGLTGKADDVRPNGGFSNQGPGNDVGRGNRGHGVRVTCDMDSLGLVIRQHDETVWWQQNRAEQVFHDSSAVRIEEVSVAE